MEKNIFYISLGVYLSLFYTKTITNYIYKFGAVLKIEGARYFFMKEDIKCLDTTAET